MKRALLAVLLATGLVLLAVLLAGCSLPWDVSKQLGGVASNAPQPIEKVTGSVTGNGEGVTGNVTGNGEDVTGKWVRVTAHGLRVRKCPDVGCAVTGFLRKGDSFRVFEVIRAGDGNVWGRHRKGWSALCWQGSPLVTGGCQLSQSFREGDGR